MGDPYIHKDGGTAGTRENGKVTMLVVAESSCTDTLSTLEPACQAILNESGTLRFHQFPNINKYQEADKVWKELLELYVETVGTQLPFCVQSIRQNL